MDSEAVTINCTGSAHITPGGGGCDDHVAQFPGKSLGHHSQQLAGPEKSPGNDHCGQQENDRFHDDVSQLEKIRVFDTHNHFIAGIQRGAADTPGRRVASVSK
jgi:hypothetical protein